MCWWRRRPRERRRCPQPRFAGEGPEAGIRLACWRARTRGGGSVTTVGRGRRSHPLFYFLEEHQRPHVAVRGEHRATIDLRAGDILAGHLPPTLHRVVRRFLEEHHDEAMEAWRATQTHEPPGSIDQ